MISILVVDEESRYRQRLAEEMSREGYQVTTAGDTRHAKDLLNSRQWKLVLVNPYIKGNQGFDLLDQCGKDQSDPSVIVMVPQHAPKE
ncbi:MAG: response regulator, partial [Thermodesulfobacteriota bacterium]|nr:response regulator [Thermodesulfobacteriota bacterium]